MAVLVKKGGIRQLDAQHSRRAVLEELVRRRAYGDFSAFFRTFPPKANYIYGAHTVRLIEELDRTTKMVENGKCRYLMFCLPFRQGKSDVSSRRWPAWHMLRNPDHEFFITSYGFDIASSMSFEVREVLRRVGGDYGVRLQQSREALNSYGIAEHGGSVHSAGLRGAITGKGANILLIDDYYKNREEAESPTIRDKVWESFQSDLMTRLSPVHAVVIVANRWCSGDLVGSILRRNDPSDDDHDPDFPCFEQIVYPIYDEDKDRYLFEERFPRSWYESLRSMLGSYAWNAQGMQQPVSRGGNRFRTDLVQIHNSLDDFPKDIVYVRAWDPASSTAERDKPNPDRSAGCLAGVSFQKSGGRFPVPQLWIKDIRFGRWEAPERNRQIRKCAEEDGPSVAVGVEAVGGYKDAYVTVRDAMMGMRYVEKLRVMGDKTVQASILEPVFDAGNVHLMRGGWNGLFLREAGEFPAGDHDDLINAAWLAYRMALRRSRGSLGSIDRHAMGI